MPKQKGSPWTLDMDIKTLVQFGEYTCERRLFIQNAGNSGTFYGVLGADLEDKERVSYSAGSDNYEFKLDPGDQLWVDNPPVGYVHIVCDVIPSVAPLKNLVFHASWRNCEL